jgi:hypothetical protein
MQPGLKYPKNNFENFSGENNEKKSDGSQSQGHKFAMQKRMSGGSDERCSGSD